MNASTNVHPQPRITPEILEFAYRQGIFPMGDPHTGEIHWYQPEPRATIDIENFHVSRRLAKTLRSGRFRFTVNAAFRDVMRACARWNQPDEAWITPDIIELYCHMRALGKAHSLEAWDANGELVGGLYGIALGGAFMGESMFHTARDASKACLARLVERLRRRGFILLDTQFPTSHLSQFGLDMLPHAIYLERLEEAMALETVRFT